MDVLLFPLVNVTLFPKTTKPLNIFEPRYIEMIHTSIDTNTPIALGFIETPTTVHPVVSGHPVNFVRKIAGFGRAQIIETRANGTLLVFINGEGKCRLGVAKNDHRSFITCEAEVIPEQIVVEASLVSQVSMLNKILARWITMHIPDPVQRDFFLEHLKGPEEVVGAFASYLVKDHDLQQMVLEFDTLKEKIEFLGRLALSGEVTV